MVVIKLNRNESVLQGTNVGKLKEFQRKQLFTDVILLCEDELYHAHKIVITAAANNNSRMKLLFTNLMSYSTVLMTGVKPQDVENLIFFLYSAEVSIPSSQVKGFLKAAHILRVDRIEPNPEIEIPSDMIFKAPENQVLTPLHNINNGNSINVVSHRRQTGLGTANVVSLSETDQENRYYDVARDISLSQHRNQSIQSSFRSHTSNALNARIAGNFGHSHQQIGRRQRSSFSKQRSSTCSSSSSSSKHPPEKFREEVFDNEYFINSIVSPYNKDGQSQSEDVLARGKNMINSLNSPEDTPTPVRGATEDSWRFFHMTGSDATITEGDDSRNERNEACSSKSLVPISGRHPLGVSSKTSSVHPLTLSHPKTSTPSKDAGEHRRHLFFSPPPNNSEDNHNNYTSDDYPSDMSDEGGCRHHQTNSNLDSLTEKQGKNCVGDSLRKLASGLKVGIEKRSEMPQQQEKMSRMKQILRLEDKNEANSNEHQHFPSTPKKSKVAANCKENRHVIRFGKEIKIILRDFRKMPFENNVIGLKINYNPAENEEKIRYGATAKAKRVAKIKKNNNNDNEREKASAKGDGESTEPKRKVLRTRKPRVRELKRNSSTQSMQPRKRGRPARALKEKHNVNEKNSKNAEQEMEISNIRGRLRKRL